MKFKCNIVHIVLMRSKCYKNQNHFHHHEWDVTHAPTLFFFFFSFLGLQLLFSIMKQQAQPIQRSLHVFHSTSTQCTRESADLSSNNFISQEHLHSCSPRVLSARLCLFHEEKRALLMSEIYICIIQGTVLPKWKGFKVRSPHNL